MAARTAALFAAALATVMSHPLPAADAAGDPTPELASYLSTLPAGWRSRADTVIRRCETKSTYRIPVLVLSYFPVTGPPQSPRLDPDITGVDEPLAEVRARVAQTTHHVRWALELGSTYHALRNAAADCAIEYDIVDQVEYLEALPVSGFQHPWAPWLFRPDYMSVLKRENVCQLVEKRGVKEVWLWGYEHGNLGPTESNMAGPNGDVSNSERIADLPVCARTYTLYNYNYGRRLGEALHNHGHQFEAVLGHLDRRGLFADFVGPYGQPSPTANSCGNVHFPPNGRFDYDWQNPAVVMTDCRDWKPRQGGQKTRVSCASWECKEDGAATYLVWWTMNFPGRGNRLSLDGRALRNWWEPIARFDAVVASGTGLLH